MTGGEHDEACHQSEPWARRPRVIGAAMMGRKSGAPADRKWRLVGVERANPMAC
jgi:hypothetical protein